MQYVIILFLTFSIFFNISCGFQIQKKKEVSEILKIVRLSTSDPYGPLAYALRQEFQLNNILLTDENIQNVVTLKIIGSSENIKTISIQQDGKSAEKQLNFWIRAEMILPNNKVYPITIYLEHSFFDSPLELFRQDAEKELIKKEILEEAANQLIRKVLSIHKNILKNL